VNQLDADLQFLHGTPLTIDRSPLNMRRKGSRVKERGPLKVMRLPSLRRRVVALFFVSWSELLSVLYFDKPMARARKRGLVE
jgi:hypothetical protein